MKNKNTLIKSGAVSRFCRPITFIALAAALALSSCDKTVDPEEGGEIVIPNQPYTDIPAELAGTWYRDDNEGPLNENWDAGTFQGQQGFKEFRTMVFTQNGQNAVEYSSEIFNNGDEVKQYMYKLTGTLEYKTNPTSIRFHAQSGRIRLFSNKFTGYKEVAADEAFLKSYFSLLVNPQASYSGEVLEAKRNDGGNEWSVRYNKVSGATAPDQSGDYSKPPVGGTYVKVGAQYYPTVTIGTQEWMSVNYAGPVGKIYDSKIKNGSFIKFSDLKNIPVPAGWHIPTKNDYETLLKSQGLEVSEWGSTDGADLNSKKLLGRLMASSGWKKEDGYANNASGFNAVPADFRVEGKTSNSEGYNCVLWTGERDEYDNPLAFVIIQLPSDTYAKTTPYPTGYYPPLIPVRLVRNR